MGSKGLVRLAAAAAGGALALVAAAPAFADTTIDINPDHLDTTAEDFNPQECTEPFNDLPDGTDGWHFVLPAGTGDSFVSLTLTYDTPGGQVVVVIEDRDPDESSGAGWSGYISEAGQSGAFRHAWVFTDAGWTLTGGSAVIEEDGASGTFNLSHTCPGTPGNGDGNGNGNGKTPPPDDKTPPPGNGEPSPPDEDEKPELPLTGFQVGGLVALGLALLGGGGALMLVRKRRIGFISGDS